MLSIYEEEEDHVKALLRVQTVPLQFRTIAYASGQRGRTLFSAQKHTV